MHTFFTEKICSHLYNEVSQYISQLTIGFVLSKSFSTCLLAKRWIIFTVDFNNAKHFSIGEIVVISTLCSIELYIKPIIVSISIWQYPYTVTVYIKSPILSIF